MLSPQAFIFGFTQGFVVGPIGLFGIREGLDPRRGFWCQLQVVLGATIVDIIYLLIASYGAAEFIDHSLIKFAMWTIAAYMLISMGYNSFFEKSKSLTIQHVHRHRLKFYETDFFRALLMNIVNPTAIVFWVMIAGSMYSNYSVPISPIAFAMNIALGSFISASIIVVATLLVRRIFHPWMLKKLIKMGSLVLMTYGFYFSFQALLILKPVVGGWLVFLNNG